MSIDNYFSRTEVSNSDLTSIKEVLQPRLQFGNREEAFRFGSLVDAIITEPHRVNYFQRTVCDEFEPDSIEQYSEEDFRKGMEMQRALRAEARSDKFLDYVLKNASTQKCMVNKDQTFEYSGFQFQLDTRCKWDWWIPSAYFGGDLKTTACSSQKEFAEAVDFFDWDRSRAWYMDIAGSEQDFIFAISKKNFKVFKLFIRRDDEIYRRGRDKYEHLAFMYWCLNLNPVNSQAS